MLAGENDFFPVSFSSASSKMQCLYNLKVNGRQEKVWRASQQNVGREGLRPDGGASLPAQSKFGSGLKPLSSFHQLHLTRFRISKPRKNLHKIYTPSKPPNYQAFFWIWNPSTFKAKIRQHGPPCKGRFSKTIKSSVARLFLDNQLCLAKLRNPHIIPTLSHLHFTIQTIFSVRIWSWQHVRVIQCWVEPSLLLSSCLY